MTTKPGLDIHGGSLTSYLLSHDAASSLTLEICCFALFACCSSAALRADSSPICFCSRAVSVRAASFFALACSTPEAHEYSEHSEHSEYSEHSEHINSTVSTVSTVSIVSTVSSNTQQHSSDMICTQEHCAHTAGKHSHTHVASLAKYSSTAALLCMFELK